MKPRTKKDLHHRRKLFHMTGVLSMYAMLYYLPVELCWAALLSFSAAAIGLDLLRRYRPEVNEFVKRNFSVILRDTEIHGFAGTTYLLLGCILCFAIYPPKIVLLSLLFLGVGDPIASWFGVRFGKHKIIGKKTLEGSLAGFVVCTVLAFIYFYKREFFSDQLIVASLASGLIGILSELIPIGSLDDNFTQPLVSGLLLTIFFSLTGQL